MTTQTVIFESLVTPTTVKLIPWGGGTVITGSSIGVATGNRSGWLKAVFTGAVGRYSFEGYDGSGNVLVTDTIVMEDTTADQYVQSLAGANVAAWRGANVPAPDSAGYPIATLKRGTGAGEVTLASGVLESDIVSLGSDVNSLTALTHLVQNMMYLTASSHDTLAAATFDVTMSGLTVDRLPIGTKIRVPVTGSDAANAGFCTSISEVNAVTTDIVQITVNPPLPVAPTVNTKFAVVGNETSLGAVVTELSALLAGTDGYTLIEIIRIGIAILAGVASGATANGGTIVFKSLDGNTNRMTMTVDSYGNRSSPTILAD